MSIVLHDVIQYDINCNIKNKGTSLRMTGESCMTFVLPDFSFHESHFAFPFKSSIPGRAEKEEVRYYIYLKKANNFFGFTVRVSYHEFPTPPCLLYYCCKSEN